MWTISGGSCGLCGEFFPRVAGHNQARVCGDCAAFCLELLQRSKSATFFEHHCVSCEKTSVARAFKRLDNRHMCVPCMSNAAHMLNVSAADGLITAHYANPIPVAAPPPALSLPIPDFRPPRPVPVRLPTPFGASLFEAPFGLAALFSLRQELPS